MVRWIAIGLIVLGALLVIANEVFNPPPLGVGEDWIGYRQLQRTLVLTGGASALAGTVGLYLEERFLK